MMAAQRAMEASDYETAVSRAYYAAYHAVIACFEVRLGITRPHWTHYLAPYFRRVTELRDVRERLSALYLARIRADYEEVTFSIEEAEASLAVASAIIATAREVIDRA
jgi:uncharacterized protein (UPF0332 family)